MRTREAVRDVALATAASYVGTKAMEPVSMKLYEMESAADRERGDAVRPGPPYRVAAEKITRSLGLDLNDQQFVNATRSVSFRAVRRHPTGATWTISIPTSRSMRAERRVRRDRPISPRCVGDTIEPRPSPVGVTDVCPTAAMHGPALRANGSPSLRSHDGPGRPSRSG